MSAKQSTASQGKGKEGLAGITLPVIPIFLAAFGVAHAGQTLLTSWLVARHPDDLRRLAEDNGEEQGTAAMWVGLTAAAMLTKLTSSTDDIVWLFPFLSGRVRNRNMLFYMACMQFVVCLAWGFCAGGAKLLALMVPKDLSWPLAKILNLISAILLTLYTFKLLREWWVERQAASEVEEQSGEQDEVQAEGELHEQAWESLSFSFDEQVLELGFTVAWAEPSPVVDQVRPNLAAEQRGVRVGDSLVAFNGVSTEGKTREQLLPFLKERPLIIQLKREKSTTTSPLPTVVGATSEAPATGLRQHAGQEPVAAAGTEARVAAAVSPNKFTLRKLATISMFGSLDDFAVYVSILLSGLLSPIQLFLGTFFGSIIVVTICIGAGKFACFTNIIERVPLWAIIGAFSIWTYISTFVLD